MSGYPADEPLDAQDREVLDGLRGVLAQVDPVPDGLVEATVFAITLESLDAELMQLEQLDAPTLSVRSDTVDHETIHASTITFSCEAVTVMITISESPTGGLCIDGWAAPAERYAVELYRPDERVRVESDQDGGFVIFDVAPGRVCLALRRADSTGPTVCTPVIEL